ncbi:MAG: GNAT family N-acetyltransferase [Pseudomonadota bacterium]
MTPYVFREARRDDLDALVAMLADDVLGATREDTSRPLNTLYVDAWDAIARDPNNELIVCEDGAAIAGMLQLTFIPYLTHTGRWRGLIEGVRVANSHRGQGLGRQLLEWTIARAAGRGCMLIQLTSDKRRTDAIRFYENLGFSATHEGLKLEIGSRGDSRARLEQD